MAVHLSVLYPGIYGALNGRPLRNTLQNASIAGGWHILVRQKSIAAATLAAAFVPLLLHNVQRNQKINKLNSKQTKKKAMRHTTCMRYLLKMFLYLRKHEDSFGFLPLQDRVLALDLVYSIVLAFRSAHRKCANAHKELNRYCLNVWSRECNCDVF